MYLIWYNQKRREKLGSVITSDKDGGYFNLKGDGAMSAYTKILKKGVASCHLTK